MSLFFNTKEYKSYSAVLERVTHWPTDKNLETLKKYEDAAVKICINDHSSAGYNDEIQSFSWIKKVKLIKLFYSEPLNLYFKFINKVHIIFSDGVEYIGQEIPCMRGTDDEIRAMHEVKKNMGGYVKA